MNLVSCKGRYTICHETLRCFHVVCFFTSVWTPPEANASTFNHGVAPRVKRGSSAWRVHIWDNGLWSGQTWMQGLGQQASCSDLGPGRLFHLQRAEPHDWLLGWLVCCKDWERSAQTTTCRDKMPPVVPVRAGQGFLLPEVARWGLCAWFLHHCGCFWKQKDNVLRFR